MSNCSDEIRFFGEDLRVVAHDPEVLALDPTGGAWFLGGCFIFAEALKRYLGDNASLWMLNDLALKEDLKGIAIHVVVRVGDCFLDADGAWTRTGLLKDWKRPLRGLVLRPFDPGSIRNIKCPTGAVQALVKVFEDVFGEPSWLI